MVLYIIVQSVLAQSFILIWGIVSVLNPFLKALQLRHEVLLVHKMIRLALKSLRIKSKNKKQDNYFEIIRHIIKQIIAKMSKSLKNVVIRR